MENVLLVNLCKGQYGGFKISLVCFGCPSIFRMIDMHYYRGDYHF